LHLNVKKIIYIFCNKSQTTVFDDHNHYYDHQTLLIWDSNIG